MSLSQALSHSLGLSLVERGVPSHALSLPQGWWQLLLSAVPVFFRVPFTSGPAHPSYLNLVIYSIILNIKIFLFKLLGVFSFPIGSRLILKEKKKQQSRHLELLHLTLKVHMKQFV